MCILLPSCRTLPIEREWLLHPSHSFCPASHPVLLCKDCPVLLVTSGSQQLGTVLHQSQPSAMPQTTLPWCKACSVSSVHSAKKETAELGLPWKGHSCIQCAHIIMQNFVVRNETHMSSSSSGCTFCGLEHCYPVFLWVFSLMTYWFSRQIFPLSHRERQLPKAHVPGSFPNQGPNVSISSKKGFSHPWTQRSCTTQCSRGSLLLKCINFT